MGTADKYRLCQQRATGDGEMIGSMLFSVTSGRDSVYPGVQGAYYWTEDPWFNGPMRGYGRDEQHEGGIPIDAKLVQPNNVYNEYGVDMVGSFAPVNTYVYEPGWAPNAM